MCIWRTKFFYGLLPLLVNQMGDKGEIFDDRSRSFKRSPKNGDEEIFRSKIVSFRIGDRGGEIFDGRSKSFKRSPTNGYEKKFRSTIVSLRMVSQMLKIL